MIIKTTEAAMRMRYYVISHDLELFILDLKCELEQQHGKEM